MAIVCLSVRPSIWGVTTRSHSCLCERTLRWAILIVFGWWVSATLENGAEVGRENSVGNEVGSDLAETTPAKLTPAPGWLCRLLSALAFRLNIHTHTRAYAQTNAHTTHNDTGWLHFLNQTFAEQKFGLSTYFSQKVMRFRSAKV